MAEGAKNAELNHRGHRPKSFKKTRRGGAEDQGFGAKWTRRSGAMEVRTGLMGRIFFCALGDSGGGQFAVAAFLDELFFEGGICWSKR